MTGPMSGTADVARRFGWAALLVVLLGVYALEANARRRIVPTPATQGDQGAYLKYAQQMHDSRYAVVGGRNRMPAFPFLLSLLYEEGMSEERFLARAQALNVALSVAILAALVAIYLRHFPPYLAAALTGAAAFGVFLYRAVFAQAEVLFYFLSFCVFLALWRMLVAPGLRLAVASGALIALAHLTKASVLPALALFVVIFAAKLLWELRAVSNLTPKRIVQGPLLLAVVVGTFLLGVFPYIQTSKRIFGQYFYNVNSTFYMWCDSFEEAKALTRAHGDRSGWPNLPPEQIPSASKYWREHSVRQICTRIAEGLWQILSNNAVLYGYYKYVLALAGAMALVAFKRRIELRALLRLHIFAAAFITLFFSGYLLLYAWYEPLSGHSRFLLALFLPFTFVAAKVVMGLGAKLKLTPQIGVVPALAFALLVFAAGDALHAALYPAHPTLSQRAPQLPEANA